MATPAPKNEETMRMIEALAGYGLTAEQIGDCIGWGVKKVRGVGKDAMRKGTAVALAKVAKTLYQMATDGQNPAATFFYLKTRGRSEWRESGPPVDVDLPVSPILTHKEKTAKTVEGEVVK